MAPIIDIANAIAAKINAAVAAEEFDRKFEAKVLWANRKVLLSDRELGDLRVNVVPENWTESLEDRASSGQRNRFTIVVRKRFDEVEDEPTTGEIADEEIQSLITLTWELLRLFVPLQPDEDEAELGDEIDAVWMPEDDLETNVTIVWPHLEEKRQFTAFFPVTFETSE